MCTRDPHQLFQLLCIQLRCISIAYSDGLKKMLKTNGEDETPTYNPVELLTCMSHLLILWLNSQTHIYDHDSMMVTILIQFFFLVLSSQSF